MRCHLHHLTDKDLGRIYSTVQGYTCCLWLTSSSALFYSLKSPGLDDKLYGYLDIVEVKISNQRTLLPESLTQSNRTKSGNLFREQYLREFVSVTFVSYL